MVASVVANITMRKFPGYQPTYVMPAFPPIANMEVILFVGLGILAGFLAPLFLHLIDACKSGFQVALQQDLAPALPDAKAAGSKQAKDFLRRDFLPVITPRCR
jgi:H+/Cl- antiporter ClcA